MKKHKTLEQLLKNYTILLLKEMFSKAVTVDSFISSYLKNNTFVLKNDLQETFPQEYNDCIDAVKKQLIIDGVVRQSEQLFCEDKNEHCTDDIDGLCRDCWISKNEIDFTK